MIYRRLVERDYEVYAGTEANRPTAGQVGRYYFCTDSNKWCRDNGTSWVEVSGGAGAAHDLGGALHNADTLANLNTKVSDATLDDSGDPRDPNAHKDSHDPNDGADPLDTAAPSELASVQAAGVGTSHSLARADHQHQIQHAITDNHLVTVDGTVVDGQRAYWNADGLQGFADVGTTFPSPPQDGMTFCHEVTGRKIVYVYDADNTTWIPIISIGTMTLYVDKTDGSDSLEDHGTGVDGDAFATIQYAVDCIPGLVGGSVTININAEDYDETVTIQGKAFTGDYSITLQGTLSENTSGTQSANGVTGTGGTQGSFTDVGNLAGVANLLAYLDADGDYRIIDSTDGDTATICGTFTSQPLQNENYVVYDWGTTVNKFSIKQGQVNIYIYDIKMDTSNGLTMARYSQAEIYRCYISGISNNGGRVTIDTCYVYKSADCINVLNNANVVVYYSKVLTDTASDKAIRLYQQAQLTIARGSVIDCSSQAGTHGIYCEGSSYAGCYSGAAVGYVRIRNCATGISALTGGQVLYTSNNQYSGNTADETATAASFGYID